MGQGKGGKGAAAREASSTQRPVVNGGLSEPAPRRGAPNQTDYRCEHLGRTTNNGQRRKPGTYGAVVESKKPSLYQSPGEKGGKGKGKGRGRGDRSQQSTGGDTTRFPVPVRMGNDNQWQTVTRRQGRNYAPGQLQGPSLSGNVGPEKKRCTPDGFPLHETPAGVPTWKVSSLSC